MWKPAGQQQQQQPSYYQQDSQQQPPYYQQNLQQHQADIGQATNATPGSLSSYETVAPDQGVGNDVGKYKNS